MTMLESVFRTVLNQSLSACLVILAVMAVRLLLRRAPRGCSYLLWAVVLFRLLCPFSFESAVNLFTLTGTDPAPLPAGFGSAPVAGSTAGQTPRSEAAQAVLGSVPAQAAPALTVLQLLALVWLAGALALAAYTVYKQMRLMRCLRWRQPGPDGVYRVHGLETAFVLGVVRPRIYLPAGLAPEQERYILAHERTHLRRGDPVWRVLAFAALCLHWFNPLVWLAFWLSGRDMEMSCDEAVVRRCGPEIKKGYASSLLALATGRRMLPGAPLAFGEGDTAARIRNVLNYKKPGFWLAVLALAAVAGVCLFLAADPETVQPAPLEQYFSDAAGGSYTARFTLPEGLQFLAAQPAGTVQEGADTELGTILAGGAAAGTVQVSVFRPPQDADTLAWAQDAGNPNRHNVAYSYFMLGSMTDWASDYTVVSATENTEAAVTNVYENRGAAGAREHTACAALYFDLEAGAYIKIVLEPGAVSEEQLREMAAALSLEKAGGAAGFPLPAQTAAAPLTAVPADLEARLADAIAQGLVPDARRGRQAKDFSTLRPEDLETPGVVLLDCFAEDRIWLYGYYDENGMCGMILDTGETQTLTAFPYRYPDFFTGPATTCMMLSADARTLYLICRNGTGTGFSISELYVFTLDPETGVQGFAVDTADLMNQLAAALEVSYDPYGGRVTVASAGQTLYTARISGFGLPMNMLSSDAEPVAFACDMQFGYRFSDAGGVYMWGEPTLYTADGQPLLLEREDPETSVAVRVPLLMEQDTAGRVLSVSPGGGAQAETAQPAAESSVRRQAAAQWQADLTHDGVADTIVFDRAGLETQGFGALTVTSGATGAELYRQSFSTSHAGWTSCALYTDETGAYLLLYQPYAGTGAGELYYSLFRLTEDGAVQEKDSREASFSMGMPYDAPDNDVDALTAFAEAANGLWARSALLVTTDADFVLGGLYDADGAPVSAAGANYYAADESLSAPLHYVEEMRWTDTVLAEAGLSTEGTLRQRLQRVNTVLAAHRAEVQAVSGGA